MLVPNPKRQKSALSFSIHQVAERQHIEEISTHYDDLEKEMLNDFFNHIGSHRGMKYLHWITFIHLIF